MRPQPQRTLILSCYNNSDCPLGSYQIEGFQLLSYASLAWRTDRPFGFRLKAPMLFILILSNGL